MSAASATYQLYGLTVRSSLRLPGPRLSSGTAADLQLRPAGSHGFARWRRRWPTSRHPSWFLYRTLPNAAAYLRWTDLFEFEVSASGRDIRYHRLKAASPESFSTYLLGQVLSFSLIALGSEPLHGTVVVVNGGAVAFLGNCGYGKSTLGAAFVKLGCPLLTDDLVVLRRAGAGYQVQPGVQRIKLFPSVASGLLGKRPMGERLNPDTQKLIIPLGSQDVARPPIPLRAIYVLSPPSRRPRNRIELEPLSGSTAFFDAIANSFNTIVGGRERLARQFAFASSLVQTIPVKRLSYPRRIELLPAVCDRILEDSLATDTAQRRLFASA